MFNDNYYFNARIARMGALRAESFLQKNIQFFVNILVGGNVCRSHRLRQRGECPWDDYNSYYYGRWYYYCCCANHEHHINRSDH